MSAIRSPVVLFLATGLLSLGVIVLGTDRLGAQAAADEAVADALATTELLARSVAEPEVPRGLVDGDVSAIDRFDRRVLDRLRVPDVRRVKIWSADGRVVYSDRTELIGEVFPLDADARAALDGDRTDAEVSDLSRPENRFERSSGGLLEVYTRIDSPEGEPLLFEVYYAADAIDAREGEISSAFRPITLGALGLVVLVATMLLWALTSRLKRSAEDRERLLRTAVEASDAERVRIARDLHDGVVQDLAGASFAVAAVARSGEVTDAAREGLDDASESMRRSLRSLRSLMVEIYPPDLHEDGLQSALTDLLAPAAAHAVAATATVEGLDGVSDASVALVWRVAQEAVRNALRHADASTLTVGVVRAGDDVELTVTDDGIGFDPSAPPHGPHFGLRGMTGLVGESGGRLEVESAPGVGTVVRLRVAAHLDALPASARLTRGGAR